MLSQHSDVSKNLNATMWHVAPDSTSHVKLLSPGGDRSAHLCMKPSTTLGCETIGVCATDVLSEPLPDLIIMNVSLVSFAVASPAGLVRQHAAFILSP